MACHASCGFALGSHGLVPPGSSTSARARFTSLARAGPGLVLRSFTCLSRVCVALLSPTIVALLGPTIVALLSLAVVGRGWGWGNGPAGGQPGRCVSRGDSGTARVGVGGNAGVGGGPSAQS
ncbi:hypothetical protein OWR29_31795 [Actinoplanes sp. Pm04-4]|uniref:Uncharacterized protein n=1 Tax=Paractinoplanes pyxinae TaxID=2997416 RepID=A0ABT4B7W7_9ACTN|nr:hypothetical protein [Actinoplanes pyxinae]MCY1142604.1 hypothetical protein [Actinoplanes pyxinae]